MIITNIQFSDLDLTATDAGISIDSAQASELLALVIAELYADHRASGGAECEALERLTG